MLLQRRLKGDPIPALSQIHPRGGGSDKGGGILIHRRLESGCGQISGLRLGLLASTSLRDVLSITRSININANGVHGEAVEDGGGEGGVAEIAAPVAEHDVRRDGGGDLAVPTVDEVVEGVRGGRLVSALFDLAKAYVVDDQELRTGPGLEATGVGAIGEAGVKIVEEVDATRVAHTETLLACAYAEGLEDVAFARAAFAGEDEVVVTAHEVESRELEHEGLVEAGLEVPVEGFEGLALDETALCNATLDALLESLRSLSTERVLEERRHARALTRRPCE